MQGSFHPCNVLRMCLGQAAGPAQPLQAETRRGKWLSRGLSLKQAALEEAPVPPGPSGGSAGGSLTQ